MHHGQTAVALAAVLIDPQQQQRHVLFFVYFYCTLYSAVLEPNFNLHQLINNALSK